MAKKATSKRGGRREGAGRPRLFQDPVTLGVVMERADLETVEKAAESSGKPVADWVRDKLIAAAKRVVK